MDTIKQTKQTVFFIPDMNMSDFEAKIAKLSRKAKRLNLPPLAFKVIGHQDKPLGEMKTMHRFFMVEFDEPIIKVNGWQFAATIDHALEGGNVVRTVPNMPDLPDIYRTIAPGCDHCNKARWRRNSFVMRSETTGEYKQMGRNCLADFIGHDASHHAFRAELIASAAGDAGEFEDAVGGRGQPMASVRQYTEHCAAMIREFGWVSRSTSLATEGRLRATAGRASENLWYDPRSKEPRIPLTDADRTIAAAAVAWAAGLSETGKRLSDYEHNITLLAKADMVEQKNIGLLASIVGSYTRNSEREEARRAQRAALAGAKLDSKHVGKVGERLRGLSARVIGYTSRASDFGVTHIYRFITNDGNVLVWFASNDLEAKLQQSVTLTGTVKKHDTYEDVKNTVLTRCAVTVHPME